MNDEEPIYKVKMGLLESQGDYQGPGRSKLPPINSEIFKKGTKIKYDAKNKIMFSAEYNVESKEIIFKSMTKTFKGGFFPSWPAHGHSIYIGILV